MDNKIIYKDLVNYFDLIGVISIEKGLRIEEMRLIAKYKVFLQNLEALKVSYAIPPNVSNNSIEEVEQFIKNNAVKLFKLDYPVTTKRQNTSKDLLLLNNLHNNYKNELLATFKELTQLNISLVLPTTIKTSKEEGISAPEITITLQKTGKNRIKKVDEIDIG